MTNRFQVERDGVNSVCRFSRTFAVVDTEKIGPDDKPSPVMQTNDERRAKQFARELNNLPHANTLVEQ